MVLKVKWGGGKQQEGADAGAAEGVALLSIP